MITPLWSGACCNCTKTVISFSEVQVQRLCEEHMMETGHVMDITNED